MLKTVSVNCRCKGEGSGKAKTKNKRLSTLVFVSKRLRMDEDFRPLAQILHFQYFTIKMLNERKRAKKCPEASKSLITFNASWTLAKTTVTKQPCFAELS